MKKYKYLILAILSMNCLAGCLSHGVEDKEDITPEPSPAEEDPTGEDKGEELKTFTGITFDDLTVDYDGKTHCVYAKGVPSFATVKYTNNDKVDVGTYNVTATITADYYEPLIKFATLKINKVDMANVAFEDASFMYDGENHKIEVSGAPSGSSISYRRTNGSGTNTFKEIGSYVIEATVSHKNYVTKVLTATLTISNPACIITTDATKTPFAFSEPLMWDPVFNEIMKGNYTLFIHSGHWDTDAPNVKNEAGGTTVASDGTNCFIDCDYVSSLDDEAYHEYTFYTNCGDDIVITGINEYGLGNTYQNKMPAAAMNETVIQWYVAKAFVSLQEDNDGYIVPGIDMDDYHKDVGTAEVVNNRFVVTMQHPRSLDNGEQRYFYEVMEFYNVGNTKLEIPTSYFLSAAEIDELSRTSSNIYIDGVAYHYGLRSTWNSGSTFIARTYMSYWQQLIVEPGVHYILPDIYGEVVHRVVYAWYTEDYSSLINMDGYELNVYFDEDGNYQGEYFDYEPIEFISNRFVSYGGVMHYYDDWHN